MLRHGKVIWCTRESGQNSDGEVRACVTVEETEWTGVEEDDGWTLDDRGSGTGTGTGSEVTPSSVWCRMEDDIILGGGATAGEHHTQTVSNPIRPACALTQQRKTSIGAQHVRRACLRKPKERCAWYLRKWGRWLAQLNSLGPMWLVDKPP